jgi:hypothetical protein
MFEAAAPGAGRRATLTGRPGSAPAFCRTGRGAPHRGPSRVPGVTRAGAACRRMAIAQALQ